jgi:hypothetical protein
MIDAMLATGVTREQLAAVVKADIADREAAEAAKIEARRAKDRERQQRHRLSRDVTVTDRDQRDTPPNERENLTPPHNNPPKAKALDPKPKKNTLPLDWQPLPFNIGTMAAQIVERWEPGRMERELAKFRAHYDAAGTKWQDWQAVWCKWVNNSDDFQRGRNGPANQQPGIGRTEQAAIAALGPH